jgi:hypothetical protein
MTAIVSGATVTISGAPRAAGTFQVMATVSDTESPPQTATEGFTLTVNVPKLVITSTSLPAGVSRAAYSAAISASGGNGTFRWSVTGLPPGLTALPSGATVTISGDPTAAGTSQVTVTVTDTENPAQTATATLTLTVT